jgi:hypothetical protein
MSSAEENNNSSGNDAAEGASSDLVLGAMTTYLQPLLDKHASSNPTLAFEDLLSSWHAADRFVAQHKDDKEYGAVLKRVTDLHKGQVSAYRSAAIVGLRQFAETRFALPSVDAFLADDVGSSSSSKEAYVQHACKLAMDQRPNWKVGTGILAKEVVATVKQRAGGAFDSYKSSAQSKPTPPASTSKMDVEDGGGNKNDDDDELEGGEIDEDGEVHEDDADDETIEEGQADEDESRGEEAEGGTGSEAAKESKPSEAKKKGGTKRKAPTGIKNPKAAIRKKVSKAVAHNRTGGGPANAPGTAARGTARRGRGGGSAAAAAK